MLSTAHTSLALSLVPEIIKFIKILEQFSESSEASKILITNASIIYLGKMREPSSTKKMKNGQILFFFLFFMLGLFCFILF